MFYTAFAIITAISVVIFTFFKWRYKYWARRNVPYMQPTIPFGDGDNPFSRKKLGFGERTRLQYEHFKSKGLRHGGIYLASTPMYIPVDPDLIKNIMTKDFNHFVNHGIYFDEKHEPLSAHLFSLEGQQWRDLRVKLTPTFTSGKMKAMFQILIDCGDQMRKYIDDISEKTFDVKDVSANFTTEVIGSCAFGLECDSFKDPNSEFRKQGRELFSGGLMRSLRLFFRTMFPTVSKKIGVRIFRKETSEFFFRLAKDMVAYRENNATERHDFMQILMELKKKNEEDGGLTIEQIAAQAFVFFLAGFETSSTLMSFCLFELARNHDIQDKAREEICDLLEKCDGKFTYDGIMNLRYMSQIIDETLRMYPPAPILVRKCVKDYKVPETDVIVEEGTRVAISLLGLHYDPEFYTDPKKFDPERFSVENKAKRHPFVFLPFGEGPRVCIGLRFGQMQARVGLATILKNYRVKVSSKTVLPIEFIPNVILLATKNKIYLEFEKI